MTQLRNMNSGMSKQFWFLRRYLKQHGIVADLSFRILRYLEFATKVRDSKVADQKITILNLLTDEMKGELNLYANRVCILHAYPLFEFVHSAHRGSMIRISMKCMVEKYSADAEAVFHPGQDQESMYYLSSGHLLYLAEIESEHVEKIEKGDWLCEASLFTDWTSVGEAF